MMNGKEGKWDEEYRNHWEEEMPWFQVDISKCLTQSLMPSMMPKIHKHSRGLNSSAKGKCMCC
jgi:hypothetical protein